MVTYQNWLVALVLIYSFYCWPALSLPETVGTINYRIRTFNRALERNPNDAQALLNRGLDLMKLERFEEALKDLDRALRIKPELGTAHVFDNRRHAHISLGHLKLALADASRAIKLEPNAAWRIKERAQIYCALKQTDLALKDFDRAIAIDKDPYWSYIDRAKLFSRMHRYDRAAADLSKAIEIAPNNPAPHSMRAEMYEKLGKQDLAGKDRDRSRKLMPDFGFPVP